MISWATAAAFPRRKYRNCLSEWDWANHSMPAVPPYSIQGRQRPGRKLPPALAWRTKPAPAFSAIVHDECCAGYMALGGTVYPQMSRPGGYLPASGWPRRLTTAIRTQMRAVGAHQGLGPVLDVARDPRWGRVEEPLRQDSTLVSQFGVAFFVRGLQGRGLIGRWGDGHWQALLIGLQPVAGRLRTAHRCTWGDASC